MSDMIIKTQKENIVADNSWITLYYDDVKFPNGKFGKFNRLVEKGGKGIVIIPLDDNGLIGLLNLYRYPISSFSWELPRGFGDDTSLENNATREMSEEMGLGFRTLINLGSIHPNTGMLSTMADIVLVTGLHILEPHDIEDYESIVKTRFFTMKEVIEMILTKQITDGFTISALMLACLNDMIPEVPGGPTPLCHN